MRDGFTYAVPGPTLSSNRPENDEDDEEEEDERGTAEGYSDDEGAAGSSQDRPDEDDQVRLLAHAQLTYTQSEDDAERHDVEGRSAKRARIERSVEPEDASDTGDADPAEAADDEDDAEDEVDPTDETNLSNRQASTRRPIDKNVGRGPAYLGASASVPVAAIDAEDELASDGETI